MSYSEHRKKVLAAMQSNSMLIVYAGIPIRSNADEYYDFEVNSQFFYLTGLERHGMCLIMTKTEQEEHEILFIDPFDPLIERWTGKMPTTEECRSVSGIQDVRETGSITGTIDRYMTRSLIDTAYFDMSRESADDLPDYNLVQAQRFGTLFPGIALKNLYPLICPIRRIKDEEEIADIRRAIAVTECGLREVLHTLKPGLFEYQVQAGFEYRCRFEGAKKLAFSTIAAAGVNACMMHYVDNNKCIEEGEMILLDLGAKYYNYCSDITRTYPASGTYSPRQRQYYDLVLKANRAVAEAAKPGMTLRELDNIACEVLGQGLTEMGKIADPSEVRKYYMHSVSHSLGIDAHDIDLGSAVLEPGWVISDEPGVYIDEEKIGIRIEDDLLITEDGCIVLSESITKDPDEIEAIMRAGKK